MASRVVSGGCGLGDGAVAAAPGGGSADGVSAGASGLDLPLTNERARNVVGQHSGHVTAPGLRRGLRPGERHRFGNRTGTGDTSARL